MSQNHTPSPWTPVIYGGWSAPRVFSQSGSIALLQHHEAGPAEGEANARLIAAAPDLLDTLKYVLGRIPADDTKSIGQIKAAIAKATGSAEQKTVRNGAEFYATLKPILSAAGWVEDEESEMISKGNFFIFSKNSMLNDVYLNKWCRSNGYVPEKIFTIDCDTTPFILAGELNKFVEAQS